MIFLETSAKTGESVEEAFLKCSKTILAKIETGELDPERIGSGKIAMMARSASSQKSFLNLSNESCVEEIHASKYEAYNLWRD